MARKIRVQFPGAIYHVMNRGDRREDIFLDDLDRTVFLRTLSETCEKTSWQVHSYCLMGNHFHLVVETPNANLVAGMKWFLGVYTKRFNSRHGMVGHLFSGRYKALPVDGSGNGYLKSVCDYVHLNPVRAGLLPPDQALRTYTWSSFPSYVNDSPKPSWLRVDRLLGEWRVDWNVPAAGRRFEALMEARRDGELDEEFKPIQRGWFVGSDAFRTEMLQYIETQTGKWHYGAELKETAEAKAGRLISEALLQRGLIMQNLVAWPKNHPVKLELATRLRKQTTVTVEWIARELHMGTRGYLNHLLSKAKGSVNDIGISRAQNHSKPRCENSGESGVNV